MMSDKQIRFCEEYLLDFNGAAAARRAGYSVKTAHEQAAQLLAKLSIQDYLNKRRERLANKLQLSQEIVLEGYRKLAFYDSRKFYNKDGNLLHVPDLDEETAFALSGFEVMEERGGDGEGNQVVLGYTKKIKMSDRVKALDSICKVLGYNAAEKQEINQTQTTQLTQEQFKELIGKVNGSD